MQYTKLRRYNSDIHILVIPKGRFYVTRFGLRTVSATAQALQAPVAINGGDYNAYGAVGLAASDGAVYSKQVEWQPWVNFTRSNIPQINAFDSPESKWFQSTLPAKGATATSGKIKEASARYWPYVLPLIQKTQRKSIRVEFIRLLRCNLPANLTAISWALRVRKARFQVINVPSRSRLAFAPICSTLLRHSSPR